MMPDLRRRLGELQEYDPLTLVLARGHPTGSHRLAVERE
jgi:hypothetical protein